MNLKGFKGRIMEELDKIVFLFSSFVLVLKRKNWVFWQLLSYSKPHFLVTFTIRKMTKATITKVMTATKKFPIPNI